jgi:hypothetical protein
MLSHKLSGNDGNSKNGTNNSIDAGIEQNQDILSDMAKRMHTSRSALNRLLDPNNTSVMLPVL